MFSFFKSKPTLSPLFGPAPDDSGFFAAAARGLSKQFNLLIEAMRQQRDPVGSIYNQHATGELLKLVSAAQPAPVYDRGRMALADGLARQGLELQKREGYLDVIRLIGRGADPNAISERMLDQLLEAVGFGPDLQILTAMVVCGWRYSPAVVQPHIDVLGIDAEQVLKVSEARWMAERRTRQARQATVNHVPKFRNLGWVLVIGPRLDRKDLV